jgi:hypothetical protein
MDERHTRVSDLLGEAAETHHRVFRITDGTDDDWATWYAEWLVTLSELPGLLGGTVVRSELTWLLVGCWTGSGTVDGRRRLYQVDLQGLQRLGAERDTLWEPALLALKQAAEASDRP